MSRFLVQLEFYMAKDALLHVSLTKMTTAPELQRHTPIEINYEFIDA